MGYSRLPLTWVLSSAVVTLMAAARPVVATAQDRGPAIEAPSQVAVSGGEPMTRELEALARAETRIAFGVRRGAIQHVVTRSPFDDAYDVADGPRETVTLVTAYRFGQRAAGGVRMLSSSAPSMGLGPYEEPSRIGPHAPILWNLAQRVRIAFGSARSAPAIVTAIDRPTAPIGSLTIEFGDRK